MKSISINSLVWNVIGQNNFSLGGSFNDSPICVMVNGLFTVIYAISDGSRNVIALYCFSCDTNGNICTYITPSYRKNIIAPYVGGTCYQIGNSFRIINPFGYAAKFTIPNVFTPGETYVFNFEVETIPASPCGSGIFGAEIDYFPDQNLVGYHYTFAYGGGPVRTYANFLNNENVLIAGGEIGYFPNGNDGYNQFVMGSPYQSNGEYIQSGYIFRSNFDLQSGQSKQAISWAKKRISENYQQLACGSYTPVYMSAVNPNYIQGLQLVSAIGQYPNTYQHLLASGFTDLDNIFSLPAWNVNSSNAALMSKDFILTYNTPIRGYQTDGAAYLSAQKTLFHLESRNVGKNIYIASFDLSSLGLGIYADVSISQFRGLANYHRAVSPSGIFQA